MALILYWSICMHVPERNTEACASRVCGFTLAETMAHLPYRGLGKNKLKMKSIILRWWDLNNNVANSLHASNGEKNRWTQLALIESYDLKCFLAPVWPTLGMIVILSQYFVETPDNQQLCWIVMMGLKISELWPFTLAPPGAVFSKLVSALAGFCFVSFKEWT